MCTNLILQLYPRFETVFSIVFSSHTQIVLYVLTVYLKNNNIYQVVQHNVHILWNLVGSSPDSITRTKLMFKHS